MQTNPMMILKHLKPIQPLLLLSLLIFTFPQSATLQQSQQQQQQQLQQPQSQTTDIRSQPQLHPPIIPSASKPESIVPATTTTTATTTTSAFSIYPTDYATSSVIHSTTTTATSTTPATSTTSPTESANYEAPSVSTLIAPSTKSNTSDLSTITSQQQQQQQQNESFTQDQVISWTSSDDDSIEPVAHDEKPNSPTTVSPINQSVTNNRTATYSKQRNNSYSTENYHNVHPLLIYSNRYEIRSIDLNNLAARTSNAESLARNLATYDQQYQQQSGKHSRTLIGGLKNTIGLDFYYSDSESFIFWTDVIEERIYKGTITNGAITNAEMVVQTGLATAEGLAVDWIGQNIYWVESTLDHIEVANMKGSYRRTLLVGDMESPRAIAVDPRYGLLFWTDWDKKSPRIERATMSGDDRQTLVQIKEVNGGWPNGLTLDYDNLKIYWIDANSDSIHYVDYDGKDHHSLLKNIKSLGHPFSITLYENNLYWTDWKTNSVSMANKYNGSDVKELQRLTSRLFDIKVFHPSRQPRIEDHLNPCFENNGNCSHLCLLSINGTRKCECPHLMKLAQDNKTCETYERVLLIGRTNEIRAVDISEPLHHIMAPISVPKVFNPRQFEYDSKTKSVFWADSQTNEVKRVQLAGNNIDTIIDVIIESPSGLALDWISGNIYVTSISQPKAPGKIFISNLNGEYISILMDSSQGVMSPKSIAVHPTQGLLFCVDEGDNFESSIFMASMDGKNKRIIASKLNDPKLDSPSNLAVDYELDRVYWINQANNSSDNASIQYYDIMKDRIVMVLDESEIPAYDRINPSVLCVDGDYLIVSGRIPFEAIMKISKYNLTERSVLRTQNLDQLSALRVYNATSQFGTNACSVNNGGCSQLCVPTNSTHKTCKCTMGYSINQLNETECIGKDLFLILSYNLGMKGISIEPNSSPDDYFLPPIHRAFRASSIDYIHKENLIYWVDNEEGSITRINRDTTNYQVIIQGLESEESIGIDWVAGNIYWLDPYYDIIEVARLNGSNRYVIVGGDMDKANGIVVNPIKGYIVWSDIGSYPKIETARLDGSNRRVIVSANISHVDDLAIDYHEDYIYWVDSTLNLIERIKEDGTGRQVIHASGSNPNAHNHFVSIAIYKDYLYIADSAQHQGSIIRCDKNNASNKRVIQQQLGEGIRDISVFAEQPIPKAEDNPCVKDNGGCQDLCLFMGSKGKKKCICSHGRLRQDGLSCEPYDTFVLFSKLDKIDTLHIKDDESFNNSPYPPISIENRGSIISLTMDYNAKRVIYSEISRDQICSVLFNGTDKRVLVEKQSLVEGIAFSNDQLYWTSIHDMSISRLNTSSLGMPKQTCDSSGCRTATVEKIVKLTHDDKPRGIAVDSCTSYVYWTNWNSNASIQRASPHDGYKIESIIKTNIKVPNGIAIDQKLRKLYWCDARLDKIETCDMDGSNRIILISASPQHPFALAIWENYVFWTDWLARGVFKADKYTGQQPVQIKKVNHRPMGITVAAPEVSECSLDQCSINNGGCPPDRSCSFTDGKVLCKHRIDMHTQLAPRCKYSRTGCDPSSYQSVIMDRMDRYSMTDLMPAETKASTVAPASTSEINIEPGINTKTASTESSAIIPPFAPNLNTKQSIMPSMVDMKPTKALQPDEVSSHSRGSEDILANRTYRQQETLIDNKSAVTNRDSKVSSSVPTPVSSSTTLPPPTQTNELPQTAATAKINSELYNTTINTIAPSISKDLSTNSTTSMPPCQIIPAALQPTTDSISNNECKGSGQYKCYLSEKLVCIPVDRRCDGNHDCPSKEDENDCYLGKRGPNHYNLKHETNWHRFVTVILVILAAAVAALFLVFGSRGRRRWFVGTTGAFNHRRMFDDNGTNIEISNPMFDEDDPGNLVHCAFSIDLNERTTNFSNPLYERQVLLMNDKHVTSN